MSKNSELSELQAVIADVATVDFGDLIRLVPRGPQEILRFANWSSLSFKGCDLRGFDFTGARLIGCDFTDALIQGARFDQAEIDIARPYAKLDPDRTNLRRAKDWEAYARHWRKAKTLPSREHLPTAAVFQDAPFAPELVVVPSGTFWMGSPDGSGGDQGDVAEEGRLENEGPRHQVTIAEPFAVGRFAVTFEEWEVYAEATGTQVPDDNNWGKGRRPVINVSWDDAQKYILWLNERTGQTYRLLTEAEWEFCCRAGTATRYAFGDNISREQAQFSENSFGDARKTIEVGSFAANDFGLHDMHGNVWEWCEDGWHENYREAPDDGSAWTSGNASSRVLRGGSWINNPQDLRSADRFGDVPSGRNSSIGFRVARTL